MIAGPVRSSGGSAVATMAAPMKTVNARMETEEPGNRRAAASFNNLMERFFREVRSGEHRHSGHHAMSQFFQSMLAAFVQ